MKTFALSYEEAEQISHRMGTPTYLYDEGILKGAAEQFLEMPNAYGLTVRYAMKASPNASILRLFESMGLSFDASTGHEVERLLHAGVGTTHISISTQELPDNFADFVDQGVELNACSLNQLERFGQRLPGRSVGIRVNPGLGSGGTNRTNVGGPGSSFGIWHEFLPDVLAMAEKYDLTITRVHSHIGSGSDPAVWERAASLTLDLVRQIPTVDTVNLGGGFKVARIESEKTTDLQLIGGTVKALFEAFAKDDGRELKLEIEPGTMLVARSCVILSKIQDIVTTGSEGYTFYKLNTGMTEILRPSMYGAQHTFDILADRELDEEQEVIVVGHCCESGDILTPAPGDPEGLAPRTLPKAEIGDFCIIRDTGAYCSAMSAKNYNSFPEAPELLRAENGSWQIIRRRQELIQFLENEVNEHMTPEIEDLRPSFS
tara:strand:- start:3539 stop:4831 length:1293 start_codon:yes stop_codon:yes gene_type:complete